MKSITFEGTCTGDIFESFIVNDVLPSMNRYPEERSVLVIDNALIHHSNIDTIRAVYRAQGVILLFLLPYSPDLNPIKESFTDLKSFIRRHYKSRIREFDGY